MKTFNILSVSLAAGLLLATAAQAGDVSACIQMQPAFTPLAADAGGFSLSTGEAIVGTASLVAFVEDAGGSALSTEPRQIYIFTTASGQHVVRILSLGSPGAPPQAF